SVALVRATVGVSVKKPPAIAFARAGIAHELQLHRLPNAQAVARLERSPVHPAQGQVLSAGTRSDRVPFSLQLLNHLERKEADRTVRSAVDLRTPLAITADSLHGDAGLRHWQFRHPAVGHIDLMYMGKCTMSHHS